MQIGGVYCDLRIAQAILDVDPYPGDFLLRRSSLLAGVANENLQAMPTDIHRRDFLLRRSSLLARVANEKLQATLVVLRIEALLRKCLS